MEQSSIRDQDLLSAVKQWQQDWEKRMLGFEARMLNILEDKQSAKAPPPQDNIKTKLSPSISPHIKASEEPSAASTFSADEQGTLEASDLPTFKNNINDKLDVDDWIEQIQAIYDYANISEAHLLSFLPVILQEDALDWFIGLRNKRKNYKTWDDWKNALRNAFRAPNYLEKIHMLNSRRHLQDSEPFAHYFQQKLHLVNKRYGDSISDSIKIEEIICGMPAHMHALIRTHHRHSTGPSIESLRRTLLELEDGLQAAQQDNNTYYSDEDNNHTDEDDNYGDAPQQQDIRYVQRHIRSHQF